jgi:hypothetical protein
VQDPDRHFPWLDSPAVLSALRSTRSPISKRRHRSHGRKWSNRWPGNVKARVAETRTFWNKMLIYDYTILEPGGSNVRQSVRHSLHRWKDELFREPGSPGRSWLFALGRWYFVLVLLVAGFALYYAFTQAPSKNPLPLAVMSVSAISLAMAELLPSGRTMLAGVLRLVGGAGFVSVLIMILVSALTSS